jgi:branched-chain amino acid transport system permease protein
MNFRSLIGILAVAAAFAVATVSISNSYYQLMLTLVIVWAIFGSAWNVFSGYTGLSSFGHAAFFGLGAYTTALGQIYFDLSPWLLIPIASVVGAIAGLLVGFPTFRLRSHYFALAMLAYPLALLNIFEWLGLQEVTLPMKRESPVLYMQFSDPRAYTFVALAALIAIMVLTRFIERSRFGLSLLAIRQNEAAAEAAGVNTRLAKLQALTLSAGISGGIGAFYAVVMLVVTPISVFGIQVSALALTVAMFGGLGTVWGPIIGSAILIPTSEILQAELGARLPGIQGVIYGLAIVAVVLLAPEGIYWKFQDFLRARSGRSRLSTTASSTASLAVNERLSAAKLSRDRAVGIEKVISVRGLSVSFGGLKAVQDVSFDVFKGEILGIIGPNGAGKTTLFNLLNGFLRPERGEVSINGANTTGLKPHLLCRMGVGRTFQVMRPFSRMTVLENVCVAAHLHSRNSAEAEERAYGAIHRVGLGAVAQVLPAQLTTKQLRLMELARALANQPTILLLDETLAGLGAGEADEVVDSIKSLASDGTTVVIIEHTMRAMVALADRFVVLDRGKMLVEGPPQTITNDMRVVEAYLGRKWAHASR